MKKGLMIEGSIIKHIVLFSIPLLFGNIFQLMYNTADSLIVGRYLGKEALAAVGSGSPLINLMIAFFMGLSVGSGVIVSRYFGAKKYDRLRSSIHTFVVFSFVFGIVLSILGIFLTRPILLFMKTPSDVIDKAVLYLQIYFSGSVFVCLYNAGTGVLQSCGDSKTPLSFLIISSIINVILDICFIKYLHMGVDGAAYATIISQLISCILVLYILLNTKQEYKLDLFKTKSDLGILKSIVKIGLPAGLQGTIVSFSNLIVQSYVNSFGSVGVAAFSSANKFDNFLGMPINSFALAITTFTGQNLGAKKYDRVKKGIITTVLLSTFTVSIIGSFIFIFSKECIQMFSNDKDVIKTGSMLIRSMNPFYFILAINNTLAGSLRASGRSMPPMIFSITSFVIIRQILLKLLMPVYNSIILVGFSYSITWTIATIMTLIYFFTSNWLNKEIKSHSI